jgi:acyl carrier protein
MSDKDRLLDLLIEFFNLPSNTGAKDISQNTVSSWDSLAMVQLISELQATFSVEFDLDEIQRLRSYDEIRTALASKGIFVQESTESA